MPFCSDDMAEMLRIGAADDGAVLTDIAAAATHKLSASDAAFFNLVWRILKRLQGTMRLMFVKECDRNMLTR